MLVTSFNPLKVWLYRGGFARFSNMRYSSKSETIRNTYIHLTNVSIQKHNSLYNRELGTKSAIHSVKLYLMSIHGEEQIEQLFKEIENCISLSISSVAPLMMQDKKCFELFGYDILIDSNLKPWLIEVNASPSLGATNVSDKQLKVFFCNHYFF